MKFLLYKYNLKIRKDMAEMMGCMISNTIDIQQYREAIDEQFYLDPEYEHSFYYLCGEYVPFPAVCYIKKHYQYLVQYVPIDRKIRFDHDEWIALDNIDEFIWNNRYNIYYSELSYVELTVEPNNIVADRVLNCKRGDCMELNYKFNPHRKEIEYWEVIADQILQILIDAGTLSEEYRVSNGTKGEAVSYGLYGICNGVILLQQNYSCKNRTYGEWHTKKKYFITDGQSIEQVSTPLRYLKKDKSIDGVMKHFAKKLANECLKHKILFNENIEDTLAS